MSNTKTDVTYSLPDGWRIVRLGDVADITKGTSITKSQTIPGDIPVIGGGFVPSYYHNQANRMGETVTVSASGAHAGFVSYHNGPIFASDCSTIKPKNDHISTKFLFRLLKSKQAYIYDRQSGTGQPHIYPKDLQGIRVPLPSSQEQHAICRVLNSVDDAIERTEGVIGATEQVRDALAYELLIRGMPGWHREWRDVPGVGTLPASWDVARLGDVAEVVTGGTPLRSCADYYGGTTPWVKPTDLAKGNTVSTSEEYLTDDGVAVSRLLPQGSVLVSCIGTIGEVAIAAIPMCTNQQINALVPNEKVVSSFLYWVCTSLSDFLRTSAAKTAVPILNKSSFSKVTIPLPSIREQNAIARLLNSVDDSLECLRAERDSMAVLKGSVADGLLTGRVRVPVRD